MEKLKQVNVCFFCLKNDKQLFVIIFIYYIFLNLGLTCIVLDIIPISNNNKLPTNFWLWRSWRVPPRVCGSTEAHSKTSGEIKAAVLWKINVKKLHSLEGLIQWTHEYTLITVKHNFSKLFKLLIFQIQQSSNIKKVIYLHLHYIWTDATASFSRSCFSYNFSCFQLSQDVVYSAPPCNDLASIPGISFSPTRGEMGICLFTFGSLLNRPLWISAQHIWTVWK